MSVNQEHFGSVVHRFVFDGALSVPKGQAGNNPRFYFSTHFAMRENAKVDQGNLRVAG